VRIFQKDLFERAFVVIALLFYSGALVSFIPGARSSLLAAHPLVLLVQATANTAFAISLFLIAQRWKYAIAICIKEKLLWVLVSLIVASILWSDLPTETFINVLPFLRVTVFGIYFATRFCLRDQIKLLTWVFAIAAVLSLLFAIALPKYGVVGRGFISGMEDIVHQGRWRGIYVHKTLLGTMMVMGMLIFLARGVAERKNRWVMWIGFCLCFFILQMSTTRGALAAFVITLLLVPFYRALRWKGMIAIPFFSTSLLISGIVISLLVTNAEQVLRLLGRDITLTGRTVYWPLMLEKIWERPWLGYGYQTFWIGGWKGEVADVWRYLAVGNEPPHAHNGFLNLWFSVGLVGLGFFVLGFLLNYYRSITWMRTVHTIEGLVPIVYLTMTLLLNLTESFLAEANIFWIIYISVTLSTHQNAIKN
jgi:O-antigen ligase